MKIHIFPDWKYRTQSLPLSNKLTGVVGYEIITPYFCGPFGNCIGTGI